MTKEANFRKKIFSNVESVISLSGPEGIDTRDVVFHMKRHYGASERMVNNYIDELIERSFVLKEKDILVWNTKRKG